MYQAGIYELLDSLARAYIAVSCSGVDCSVFDVVLSLSLSLAERYIPGVGRGVSNTDALKREIIHRLYIAPQSHSELVKQFRVSSNGRYRYS